MLQHLPAISLPANPRRRSKQTGSSRLSLGFDEKRYTRPRRTSSLSRIRPYKLTTFPPTGASPGGEGAMGIFGDFQVRIDPWQTEYGSELAADSETADATESVLQDVEVPRPLWRPLAPQAASLSTPLVFVDGVRRVEARIQVPQAAGVAYGAFGSYAVGGVRVEDGAARFSDVRVDRVVATGSGIELPNVVPVMPTATYRPIHAPETDADAPLRRIQYEMRQSEERLARELGEREETLVVADGPLTFAGSAGRGHTVGYIKRISEFYISDPAFLGTMSAGTRTPLFAFHTQRRFARYAWFVRLADPLIGDSPLSGIVRLEVSAADVNRDQACALADATTAALPRFIASRTRDPRAPQNLIPIGTLESHLRHRMGDAALLRRHIESAVRREARYG